MMLLKRILLLWERKRKQFALKQTNIYYTENRTGDKNNSRKFNRKKPLRKGSIRSWEWNVRLPTKQMLHLNKVFHKQLPRLQSHTPTPQAPSPQTLTYIVVDPISELARLIEVKTSGHISYYFFFFLALKFRVSRFANVNKRVPSILDYTYRTHIYVWESRSKQVLPWTCFDIVLERFH